MQRLRTVAISESSTLVSRTEQQIVALFFADVKMLAEHVIKRNCGL